MRKAGIDYQIASYPKSNIARMKMLKKCIDFDVVLLHKKILNFFDAFWLRKYGRRVIYNFDDAIMYYDKYPEKKTSRWKHKKPFERTIKLANLVIAGNSYLAKHASPFNSNVVVLPTGLDTKPYECRNAASSDDKIRLVWIGSKSTLKYLVEIIPALEKIGQKFDNVVLRIICDDFFDLQQMEVEKCQWSLESQESDLSVCDIGLAPLPDNNFTRGKCGFKILQYAAAGLPTVASPVGVNADLVQNDVTGFLAKDIHQWTERIAKLIEDTQLRKKMSQNSLTMVKNYDIEVIGTKFVKLIKQSVV
jgi:glycosyltransferase involved in cell wall biosynthesis